MREQKRQVGLVIESESAYYQPNDDSARDGAACDCKRTFSQPSMDSCVQRNQKRAKPGSRGEVDETK
jgi:hypothetical protein